MGGAARSRARLSQEIAGDGGARCRRLVAGDGIADGVGAQSQRQIPLQRMPGQMPHFDYVVH